MVHGNQTNLELHVRNPDSHFLAEHGAVPPRVTRGCHPVPAAAGQGPAWDFRSSAAFSGAAEVKEDAMLCLGGKSDLSAQSLVTEQCGWVSRAHSTADPAFPALQTPRIPLAAPALAAGHGLWCSVRLEQGEKRDIFVMNGMVEILPMFFLPFLWFTY